MDPLAVIFIPGALAAGALLFGAPLAAIGYLAWRWQARRRVGRGSCGRCGESLAGDAARFLVTGVLICEPCADTLRRRLRIALPMVTIAATVFAITSSTAFVVSRLRGGPRLEWWLDGRWIPLSLPSVGIGLLTWGAIAVSKRMNRLRASSAAEQVDPLPEAKQDSLPHGV
jgi:hypothetical protein